MRNKPEPVSIADSSVPVVVLKTFNHHGIGIARSLGRLGVDVYGIGISRMVAGLHSRYFKQKFIRDVDTAPHEETVKYLLDISKRMGKRSLLIPTTDTCTIFLADYADRLREWYIFPDNPPELTHSLNDKKDMYFLAKKNNVPTPETSFPRSRADVEEYLKDATFPVMFKGIDGLAAALRSGRKMFVAKTKRELLELYDRYEDTSNPNFMLQDYIPGDAGSVWMYNGYFNKNSECLFSVTGRKIRQNPAYTGATCLGVCLKNDVVSETTNHFLKNIGYRGIIDIGYRYDKRDDKYKVLDINPRCGSTFRLFVGNNGLDMVRAEYLDLTGQNVPPSSIVEGRKWLVENWDLISSYRYFRDGNLTVPKWIKSFSGVQEYGWFAWDDLLPCFLMFAQLGLTTVKLRLRHPKRT